MERISEERLQELISLKAQDPMPPDGWMRDVDNALLDLKDLRKDLIARRKREGEMLAALTDIAHKTCGSQCNDPERKPRLFGSARCAKCIAVDAIARAESEGRV